MPQSPRSVAHAFVDAINAHDLDALAKLMSDTHRFVDSLGTVVRGRDQMRDGWAGYFRMVPDYTVVVEETFSDGPTVVLLGLARGTYAKEGRVSPENGWQTPAAWRAHVENDLLAEWRVYADNEPIRRLMAGNENPVVKDEQSANDSIISSTAVVRQAWLDAVKDCDVERLGTLVTDDVVVVHGDGRCVRGRDELMADFRKVLRHSP